MSNIEGKETVFLGVNQCQSRFVYWLSIRRCSGQVFYRLLTIFLCLLTIIYRLLPPEGSGSSILFFFMVLGALLGE